MFRITKGQQIEVLCNPANPEGALIAIFSELWLGPAVTTGNGIFTLLIGLVGYSMSRNMFRVK
jgi:hypothetical protein